MLEARVDPKAPPTAPPWNSRECCRRQHSAATQQRAERAFRKRRSRGAKPAGLSGEAGLRETACCGG